MAGNAPPGCSLVPTLTSFGVKQTESLITVPQTFTFTSDLPPRQSVKQTVTLSCTTNKVLNIPIATRCEQVPIQTTIMIPGGKTTIEKTLLSTGRTEVTITAPLTTLFSTACGSSQTTPTSTPTATGVSTQTVPSTQTNAPSNTPPPASGGAVISNSSPSNTASSNGASQTGVNNNGASSGGSSGTVIGGVIAGVIAAAILCGLLFCVMRRNRRRRFNEELQYERDVQGRYGSNQRMELDDDLGEPYDPYNMLSHNDAQTAPVPMVDRQTLINRSSRAYPSPPSAGPYSADHGYDQSYDAHYSAYGPPQPPGGGMGQDDYYNTYSNNVAPSYPSYAPEFASDPNAPPDAMSPRSSGVPEGVGSLAAAGALAGGIGAASARRNSMAASQSQYQSPTKLGQSQISHAGSDPFATTEDHNHSPYEGVRQDSMYGAPALNVATVSPAEGLRGGGASAVTSPISSGGGSPGGLKIPARAHESVGYSLDAYTYNRDTMMSAMSGAHVQGPWQTEMMAPEFASSAGAGAGADERPKLKIRNDSPSK